MQVGSNWGIGISNPCSKPWFSLGDSASDEKVAGLLGMLSIDRRGGGLRIFEAGSIVGVALPSSGRGEVEIGVRAGMGILGVTVVGVGGWREVWPWGGVGVGSKGGAGLFAGGRERESEDRGLFRLSGGGACRGGGGACRGRSREVGGPCEVTGLGEMGVACLAVRGREVGVVCAVAEGKEVGVVSAGIGGREVGVACTVV